MWLHDECSRGFFIYLLLADSQTVEADFSTDALEHPSG